MIVRSLLAALLVAASPAVVAHELVDLLSCLRANLPDAVQVDQLDFETHDVAGRTGLLHASMLTQRNKDLWRATIRVQSPAEQRGLAYLLLEDPAGDAVYTYAPGLERARRVGDDEIDGSLFGTAFSYRDLQVAFGAWLNARMVLHPTSRSGSGSETVTVYPEQTGNGVEILAEIDSEHCMVLQADVLESGVLRKRLRADPASIRRAGTFWYAASIEARDLKEHTRTTLQIGDVSPGHLGVPRSFSPGTFFLDR